MEGAISVVVLIGVMAMLVEQLIERFLGKVLSGEAIIYASAVLGIVLCVLFQLDGFSTLGFAIPLGAPYTGQVLTGIIVGSGANFYHKVFHPAANT